MRTQNSTLTQWRIRTRLKNQLGKTSDCEEGMLVLTKMLNTCFQELYKKRERDFSLTKF